MENENICPKCRMKNTPRSEEEITKYKSRINRMIGQLNGIGKMIEENRYCGDIIIQISAVESALKNLGYSVLENHLSTCVSEEIKSGNEEIMSETMDLIKKLK